MISTQRKELTQVDITLETPTDETPLTLFSSPSGQQLAPKVLLRKRVLFMGILYGALQKVVGQIDREEKIRYDEIHKDYSEENKDINDPFIRKNMQKLVRHGKVVPGCFYNTIEPIKEPLKKMRQISGIIRTTHKALKDWVLSHTQSRMIQTRALIKNVLEETAESPKRMSIEAVMSEPVSPIFSPSASKRHIIQRRTQKSSNRRNLSPHLETMLLQKRQKSLDSQKFCIDDLNKQVQYITQRREDYEFVAIRHNLMSVVAVGSLIKSDVYELRLFESKMTSRQQAQIISGLKTAKDAIVNINQIVLTHSRQHHKKYKQSSQERMLTPNRNGFRMAVKNSKEVSPNAIKQLLIDNFCQLQKQLSSNCQRFFSHETNRMPLSNSVYKDLLNYASIARYRLMHLHKQVKYLLVKYQESVLKEIKPHQVGDYERHIMNMTRILSQKYNITSKHKKEENTLPYHSENVSPKKMSQSTSLGFSRVK